MPAFQLPKPVAILLASAATVLIGSILSATSPVETIRERIYDVFLQQPNLRASMGQVAIVDIDRATLEQVGAWPWSRERLAELVDAIAAARPKAIGIDILLVGTDERSPGALARNLAALTSDQRWRPPTRSWVRRSVSARVLRPTSMQASCDRSVT